MQARWSTFAREKRNKSASNARTSSSSSASAHHDTSDTPPPPNQSDQPLDPSASSSSIPPLLTADYLPGADSGVLSTWFWDLHPTEKRDVLTITHDELIDELAPSAAAEQYDRAEVEAQVALVLQDTAYVTSLRRAFVNALHNEALIEPATITPCTALPPPPISDGQPQLQRISIVILDVLTRHLRSAQEAKQAVSRLTVITLFYLVYVSQLTAFIRYPLILALLPALYIASAQTAGPISAPDPLPPVRACQRVVAGAVLSLFDVSVLRSSVDVCCAWLLLVSWSGHYSQAYFAFLSGAAALTLVLFHIRSAWKLHHIRLWPDSMLSYGVSLYVLYLSWYSYQTFLFTLLFFFPKLATVVVSSLIFVCAASFPVLSFVQSFLYTFSAHPLLYTALYIASSLALVYSYLTSPSRHPVLFPATLVSSLMLTPPLLGSAISLALSFVGQLVVTHGLLRLLVLSAELCLLMVLAGVVVVLDVVLRRVGAWCEKRGWSGDGRLGRVWVLVLRWCMESSAVKALRVWLQQRAEAASEASGDGAG